MFRSLSRSTIVVLVVAAVLTVMAAILELLDDLACPLRFKLLGIPDRFVPHGRQARLMQTLGLDRAGIAEALRSIL